MYLISWLLVNHIKIDHITDFFLREWFLFPNSCCSKLSWASFWRNADSFVDLAVFL